MFVGHLAVALGVKTMAPRVPLAALVGASYGLDLLWPVLLLAGIEHVRVDPEATRFTPLAFDSYPWSHSLAMALVWGGLAGIVVPGAPRKHAGLLIGATLVSHWVLDWITHRPDLPLWPGGPLTGLGLWHSVAATVIVEGALFGVAAAAYGRTFRAVDAAGRWAFRGLIVFTSIIWLSGPWSPPPPGPGAVAVVALALWVLVPWAGWIERHRRAGPGANVPGRAS